MQTPHEIVPVLISGLTLTLAGCGNSIETQASRCDELPAPVLARFDAMRGPLGCDATKSLVPDPPGGCSGAEELIAAAKLEYRRLHQAGGCDGSPAELATALRVYEADFAAKHPFVAHEIRRDGFTIAAREFGPEHAGTGPTLVLMHGFPDNQHLYDRIAPRLGESYQTITFDFVGWGGSTLPPADHPYTFDALLMNLETVLGYFKPSEVVPVVHDASGWPGIDWALAHEAQVSSLVLLNTAYHVIGGAAPPYVIRALSSLDLRPAFLNALGNDELMARALFRAQVGTFFSDDSTREDILPVFEADIPRAGLISLTETLLDTVVARNENLARMQTFPKPVMVAFGADDPYLNVAVANGFAAAFPHATLDLVQDAGHYVQLDDPDAVVQIIRDAAGGK